MISKLWYCQEHKRYCCCPAPVTKSTEEKVVEQEVAVTLVADLDTGQQYKITTTHTDTKPTDEKPVTVGGNQCPKCSSTNTTTTNGKTLFCYYCQHEWIYQGTLTVTNPTGGDDDKV